jgi:hypothetical protein
MNYDTILVCPVCGDLSNDPYECIGCHQTYCKECTLDLSNYCSTCTNTIGFEYSKVARKIINDIDVKCKYCEITLKKGDLESHYNNCSKYKLTCKHDGCKFMGSKNNFIEHVMVFHKEELLDIFCREQYDEYLILSNQGLLFWINGTKDFVKSGQGKFLYSTSTKVKRRSKIKVRFNNCKDYNYCQIGFSNVPYNGLDKYLGGETGPGTWGLAGNGVIGEENKWNKNFQSLLKYSTEEITLMFDNGKIQVQIGNKQNSYLYNLGIKEAYLTVGLYHSDSKVSIISDCEMSSS